MTVWGPAPVPLRGCCAPLFAVLGNLWSAALRTEGNKLMLPVFAHKARGPSVALRDSVSQGSRRCSYLLAAERASPTMRTAIAEPSHRLNVRNRPCFEAQSLVF